MRILVTTDGSERSLRVLPHAAAFAHATGSALTLLRVLEPKRDAPGDGHPKHEVLQRVSARCRDDMQSLLGREGVKGEAAVAATYSGEHVHDSILRSAQELGATMVAMDTRGSNAVRRVLVGSVAMGVLRNSPLPVMASGPRIVRAAARTPSGAYRMAAAVDSSPESLEVLRALLPFVDPDRMRLLLLHVYAPTFGDRGERREVEEYRRRLEGLRGMFPSGLAVEVRVPAFSGLGGVEGLIVDEAQAFDANALAMSTHGRTATSQVLMGSVAMAVLRRSPLPVILARGGG